MSASQQKQTPKDAIVITSILKELGITEYEPRVVNQLLEFTYRYVTSVLEDAKVYANHAKKKLIDLEDVKLAVQMHMDKSFTNPPARDFLLEVARLKNNTPLPLVKPHCGIRLPPDRYCLNSCNYRLKSTAPKKFGHSAAYSIQSGGLKGSSMGAMGTAMKGPQLQPVKRPQNTSLTTVPRMQSISTPKPVIKFSPAPAGGMHNSPMMAPKPKIQIASMNQVEIKMEVEEQGLKRKREPDFDGADQ